MSNNKDFVVKNSVEIGGSTDLTVGTITNNGDKIISSYDPTKTYYDYKSFSVATESGTPNGIYFKSDGTKMYEICGQGDDVNEYSLSSAWDVSTASYTNTTFALTGHGPTLSQPSSIFFRDNGTSFYVLNETSGSRGIYQFNMTTAWDISSSSASYASKAINTSGEDAEPRGLFFKSDGSKAYVAGAGNGKIFQYGLTTNWDAGTGSYDSVSFDVSSQAPFPQGVAFSNDGTKMFVAGSLYDGDMAVFHYTLGTAWDISTASYTDKVLTEPSTFETNLTDVQFKTDGTKMYIVGTTRDTVYQFSSGTFSDEKELDLSTGNYFTHTLSGNTKYLFNNASTAQSFEIEVTGGSSGPIDSFSVLPYLGTGASKDLITNIDLATDGGLAWLKGYDTGGDDHSLFDTERGATKVLSTHTTSAESTDTTTLTSFNTDGVSIGSSPEINANTDQSVGWFFKDESSFFSLVSYTGTGVAQNISHNLGSVPGMVVVKNITTGGSNSNWTVWHNGLSDNSKFLRLNTTDAEATASNQFNGTAPTSTVFSVGTSSNTNANGDTFIAYLFAHDESSTSKIKCGSFPSNGSSFVNLGWQARWIMLKNASTAESDKAWHIADLSRGISKDSYTFYPTNFIHADENTPATSEANQLIIKSNGFTWVPDDTGDTWIYVAIRDYEEDSVITWPEEVEWLGGVAPVAPKAGTKAIYSFSTRDGGSSYVGVQTLKDIS